jgi:hypothetical protein
VSSVRHFTRGLRRSTQSKFFNRVGGFLAVPSSHTTGHTYCPRHATKPFVGLSESTLLLRIGRRRITCACVRAMIGRPPVRCRVTPPALTGIRFLFVWLRTLASGFLPTPPRGDAVAFVPITGARRGLPTSCISPMPGAKVLRPPGLQMAVAAAVSAPAGDFRPGDVAALGPGLAALAGCGARP